MRKVFKVENLDCANCAAKMEDAIKKIEGVQNASMRFMTQKLIIEADEADMESILDQAVVTCKKIEPDTTILR
mgnify:CR=1 FL=1